MKDEVDFLPAEKCWTFFQIDTIILGVCMARHVQITWNNKFAISLQHIKKEVSDAVHFLHADQHESLLQIYNKVFWWVWSSIPEIPEKASLQCLYNIPRKVRDEVDFFDADKHQSFLSDDFNTLGIKVFYNVMGMIMKRWRTR